jgi:hypothetical protein
MESKALALDEQQNPKLSHGVQKLIKIITYKLSKKSPHIIDSPKIRYTAHGLDLYFFGLAQRLSVWKIA